MQDGNLYQSFIIRCQLIGATNVEAAWISEAEHIQSGKRHTFGTLDDLFAFLRCQLTDLETESFKEWPMHNISS